MVLNVMEIEELDVLDVWVEWSRCVGENRRGSGGWVGEEEA